MQTHASLRDLHNHPMSHQILLAAESSELLYVQCVGAREITNTHREGGREGI